VDKFTCAAIEYAATYHGLEGVKLLLQAGSPLPEGGVPQLVAALKMDTSLGKASVSDLRQCGCMRHEQATAGLSGATIGHAPLDHVDTVVLQDPHSSFTLLTWTVLLYVSGGRSDGAPEDGAEAVPASRQQQQQRQEWRHASSSSSSSSSSRGRWPNVHLTLHSQVT
jgi:hypothetical protein